MADRKPITIYAKDGDSMEINPERLGQAIGSGWSPIPFEPEFGYGTIPPGERFLSNIGRGVYGLGKGLYDTVTTPEKPSEHKYDVVPGGYMGKRMFVDPAIAKGKSYMRSVHEHGLNDPKSVLTGLSVLNPMAPDVSKLYEQSEGGDVAGAMGQGFVDIAALVGPDLATAGLKRVGFGSHAEASPIFDNIRRRIGSQDLMHDQILDAIDNTLKEAQGKTSIPSIVNNLRKHLTKNHSVPIRDLKTGQLVHIDRGPGISFEEGLSWKSYLGDAITKLKDQPKLQRNLIQIKSAIDDDLAATADFHGLGADYARANALWSRGKKLKGEAEFGAEFGIGGPVGYGLGKAVGHPLGGAFMGLYAGRAAGKHLGRKFGERMAQTPVKVPRITGPIVSGQSQDTQEDQELPPLPE